MQDIVGAQSVETKTRVFISYSRKDMAFADKLEAALKAGEFEVFIDRDEIYAFEDWWKRIETLIGQADTVIFVLSPDAVKSKVALKEISYAASLNKRFAPIVCRQVDAGAVPEALRQLNFLFFDDPARFDISVDRLAKTLQTDIVWVRDHTRFGEAARSWVMAGQPSGLLLRTPALEMAEYWIATRPRSAPEPTEDIRAFIAASRHGARSTQRLRRIAQTSIFTLMMAVILGLVGWINQNYLKAQWRWYTAEQPFLAKNIWPYVLSATAEKELKPQDVFQECAAGPASDYCPVMIVVPPGSFVMGSPLDENGRYPNEGPQHSVSIAKPFAVSKFALTFDEWDTCVAYGNCSGVSDSGFGRGSRPVINVTFDDAYHYISWLSKRTGKTYRLLTEAEYEYATRAGTQSTYPWGKEIELDGKTAMANCRGCGSSWDFRETAPVGSFKPNRFALYDMVGNVFEWLEDCYSPDYVNAPDDGSAQKTGDCGRHVVRGGSWNNTPDAVRSAARSMSRTSSRASFITFRLARTLAP